MGDAGVSGQVDVRQAWARLDGTLDAVRGAQDLTADGLAGALFDLRLLAGSAGLRWSDVEAAREATAPEAFSGGRHASSLGMAIPAEGEAVVYADGVSSGNPGPGGWSVVWVGSDGGVDEDGGGVGSSTNNAMELLAASNATDRAAASGLRHVVIRIDSTYVRDGVAKWMRGWKRNGWRTAAGGELKNADLWRDLDANLEAAGDAGVQVEFINVEAHAKPVGTKLASARANAESLVPQPIRRPFLSNLRLNG